MATVGIERVKMNFKRLQKEISGSRTERAVFAVLSEGASMAATMTPVDTSNLINSHFVDIQRGSGGKTKGRSGYSAAYAAAVHDAPGVLKGLPRVDFGRTSNHSAAGPQKPKSFGGGTGVGNYWDPSGEPGFLRKGFKEIQSNIPKILKEAYGAK